MVQKEALSTEPLATGDLYAIIPNAVLEDETLRPNAKLLYAKVSSLQRINGFCYASNDYLSKGLGLKSKDTVTKLLRQLTDAGYVSIEIIRDENNAVTGRKIYLATNPSISDTPPGQIDGRSRTNILEVPDKQAGPLPDKYPTKNISNKNKAKNTPSKSPKGDGWEQAFDVFWEAYPKKKDKHDARRAFAKLRDKVEPSTLLSALERQKQSPQWRKDNGQYIPYPATWLHGRRWEDEPEETAPAPAFVPREEHIPAPY